MENRIAVRHIPKGSVPMEHPEGLGIAYLADHVNGGGKAQFSLMGYRGKSSKPAMYLLYGTSERRAEAVQQFFSGLTETAAMKAGFKAEREKPHNFSVGDIIHHSWGWEQTQCDYYQILAVTEHGATIQAIQSKSVPGSGGFMSERQTPTKDAFCGEPLKARINGHGEVTTLKHGSARKWDGTPQYCSWYA
jgi:hypothetical protein